MLALILYFTFLDSGKRLKLCFALICFFYFGCQFKNSYTSLDKCPDCYGDELCRFFETNQIQLTWFSCFVSVINPKWTKSVFYGNFNESTVVLKRKVKRTSNYNNNVQNVILCPNVGRFFLFDQIKEKIANKNLWLDLKTSIEPLLLLYFESQGTAWPFPNYLGACGDLIMEEYKGEPLSRFFSSDFEIRSLLAARLLKMAKTFTFAHSDLAFYFTDYSLDNMVVDSNGEIFLIDLDNVIISNKSAFPGNHLKESVHSSEILDEYNYAFSPTDICSHYISDHNYFSVCKYLLSHPDNGLLKDIPKEIKRHTELLNLLNECTLSSETSDRFSAGQNLQHLLEEIVHDNNGINKYIKSL